MKIAITIPQAKPVELVPENIPINILYEDRHIIVINKPAGLVVHPAAGHLSGTLVNALLYHCRDLSGIDGEIRPGIVHRLDKDTSGVLVAAKNETALESLISQFRAGKVYKKYIALVHGTPKPPTGIIESLIGRSTNDRKKMSVHPVRGRKSVTEYYTQKVFPGYSLIRLTPKTGRTHQIRVHMAHIGNPIAGDKQYGGKKERNILLMEKYGTGIKVKRQLLHAQTLAFYHPVTGKKMEFNAPIPHDLKEAIKFLDSIKQSLK